MGGFSRAARTQAARGCGSTGARDKRPRLSPTRPSLLSRAGWCNSGKGASDLVRAAMRRKQPQQQSTWVEGECSTRGFPKPTKPGGSNREFALYTLDVTVTACNTRGQPRSAAKSEQSESDETGTDLLSSPPKGITRTDAVCKHLLKKSIIIKISSHLS